MLEYDKIHTIWKREQAEPRRIIPDDFSLPEFKYLANNKWVFTEKVDGMNIRVMASVPFLSGECNAVEFGGKTDNAQIPATLVKRLQELFPAEKMRSTFPSPKGVREAVCLYGEGCGAGIRKGSGKYGAEPDFVLFDVNIGSWWLRRASVEAVAKALNIKVVPIVGEGTLYHACTEVQVGIKSQWGNFEAEGLVCRPAEDLWNRKGHRIITKIKARDYKALTSTLTEVGALQAG